MELSYVSTHPYPPLALPQLPPVGHLVSNTVLHLPVELRRRKRDLGIPGARLVQTLGPAVLPCSGGPAFCGVWVHVSGAGWVAGVVGVGKRGVWPASDGGVQ